MRRHRVFLSSLRGCSAGHHSFVQRDVVAGDFGFDLPPRICWSAGFFAPRCSTQDPGPSRIYTKKLQQDSRETFVAIGTNMEAPLATHLPLLVVGFMRTP